MKRISIFLMLIAIGFSTQAQDTQPPVFSIYALKGGEVSFGSNSISNVKQNDGANQISFTFVEPEATAFRKLTFQNVGMQVIIYICGEEIVRQIVQSPMGEMALSGLAWDKAEEILDVLTGESSCPGKSHR